MAHDPVRTLVGLAIEACRQGRREDAMEATQRARSLVPEATNAASSLTFVLLADAIPGSNSERLWLMRSYLADALAELPQAQE